MGSLYAEEDKDRPEDSAVCQTWGPSNMLATYGGDVLQKVSVLS